MQTFFLAFPLIQDIAMLHCDQIGGFQGHTESLCLFPFLLWSASLLKKDSSSCPTPPPHPPACFHQPGLFNGGPFLGGPDTSEHLSWERAQRSGRGAGDTD